MTLDMQTGDAAPHLRRVARIAGLLYLVVSVAALFAELFVRGRLLSLGDPARTAANILANESLYRAGAAADLVAFVADMGLAVAFFRLFRTASEGLSLLAAFCRAAHASIAAANTVNYLAPLALLGGAGPLAALGADQQEGLAVLFLRLHGLGYNVALVFFGIHCILTAVLIAQSGMLPRMLGGLLAIAGICYLTNSFAAFLAPALKSRIYPMVLAPAGLAEWALTLWLLLGRIGATRRSPTAQ